jgi:hypothetical protein
MVLQHRAILTGVLLGLVGLALGCGSVDQGPAVTEEGAGEAGQFSREQDLSPQGTDVVGGKGFYPLDIGNHWGYAGELVVILDGDTSSVTATHEERLIIGTEERFGREYVLERQETMDADGDTLSVSWLRYRQDRAGLYGADIPTSEPPLTRLARASAVPRNTDMRPRFFASLWREAAARVRAENAEAYRAGWDRLLRRLAAIDMSLGRASAADPALTGRPGGVLPDEITRLRYPLRPSQEWVVREEPFEVGSVVESHDVLDLPPGNIGGWRIRITNAYLGPNDLVHLWYGRDGFLGHSIHVEEEIVDPGGDPLGTVVLEESLFLDNLDLVGKGRW